MFVEGAVVEVQAGTSLTVFIVQGVFSSSGSLSSAALVVKLLSGAICVLAQKTFYLGVN
jgi:hypothetical protein